MRLLLLFITFLFFSLLTFSQTRQLSPQAEISVLTVGPGIYLQDTFGHCAYRIKDSSNAIDLTFGYGAYDFSAPYFYLKFARGKLNYKLDIDRYNSFYQSYVNQNRTIEEQVLNLSLIEKQQLFDFLINNAKPENRFYLYDFFYNNCATKIRDVANEASSNAIVFNKPESFEPKTFRELIHEHVYWNSWGRFGIDMALGSVIDNQATPEEHMFLPKYIHTFFGSAKIEASGEDLVKRKGVIFQKLERPQNSNVFLSPMMAMSLLSLIILLITYSDYKKQKRSKWLDISVFILTGFIGIIMLLLWFATDHSATAHNYNLLWAFALNIFMIGQLMKNTPNVWFKKYVKFLIIMLCLLSLHWFIGVQVFAFALIPILLALLVRYIFLIRFLK